MPRTHTETGRVELRLSRLDLSGYIVGSVLPKAAAEVAQAERLALSERDSLRVLALLESPPAAPDRLIRAAKASFTLK